MIELYRRLARGCRSVNDLNRLHIALENRLTPLELEALRSALPPAPPAWLRHVETQARRLRRWVSPARVARSSDFPPREWIEKLHAWSARSGKRGPEPFVRRRLRGHLTLFEAGGDRATKTLALCFAGRAQRMMMPLPVFLQHFDATRVDVAFLRDPTKNGYRSGIRGVATDLESALDGLRSHLQLDAYRSAASIGTSGGGLPAVLAALRLNLDAALSVGGNSPDDPRWRTADGVDASDLLKRTSDPHSRLPSVFLAFGADAPKDRSAAEALAAVVPAKLIAIGDPGQRVGHNALVPLLHRGELAGLLSTILGAAELRPR